MVIFRSFLYGANTANASAISFRATLVILRSRRSVPLEARRVTVSRISVNWSRLARAPRESSSSFSRAWLSSIDCGGLPVDQPDDLVGGDSGGGEVGTLHDGFEGLPLRLAGDGEYC